MGNNGRPGIVVFIWMSWKLNIIDGKGVDYATTNKV